MNGSNLSLMAKSTSRLSGAGMTDSGSAGWGVPRVVRRGASTGVYPGYVPGPVYMRSQGQYIEAPASIMEPGIIILRRSQIRDISAKRGHFQENS